MKCIGVSIESIVAAVQCSSPCLQGEVGRG